MDSYKEALDFIHGRTKFKKIPTLKRMFKFLELLGNPQKKVNAIHIAGTNGKGSTLAYLRYLFQLTGYQVGSFTSPFLIKFNERISVNGEPISDAEILRLANHVKPIVDQLDNELPEGGPTEFEIITAMMFSYFAEGHADVVLIETGLGGLFDSTNVVTPQVSVITTIGYDHMNILGDTLEKIAAQKAGIIKDNVPVVVGNVAAGPMKVIQQTANSHGSTLYKLGRDFHASYSEVKDWMERFVYSGFNYSLNLKTKLLGEFQAHNASVAVSAYLVYCKLNNIQPNGYSIQDAIKITSWAGRFERLSSHPFIYIDGAHNVPAAQQLVKLLNTNYFSGKIYIVIAILADKQAKEFVDEMSKVNNVEITLTTFNTPMNRELFDAVSVEQAENKNGVKVNFEPDYKDAINHIKAKMGANDLLLMTGSLYFISDVRAYLLEYSD